MARASKTAVKGKRPAKKASPRLARTPRKAAPASAPKSAPDTASAAPQTPENPQNQQNPQEMFAQATASANAALGTLISLMLQSEAHQTVFLQDLKWLVVPPLLHSQFRIFRVRGVPCGYLTWASVTEETEARLLQGKVKLQPAEWTGGDRLWVMDIMLPPQLPEGLIPMITEPFENPAAVKMLELDDQGRPVAGALPAFLQSLTVPAAPAENAENKNGGAAS